MRSAIEMVAGFLFALALVALLAMAAATAADFAACACFSASQKSPIDMQEGSLRAIKKDFGQA